MKIESTEFTSADVQQFLDEMLDHERNELADRLQKASDRLADIGSRVKTGRGTDEWSAHEVLAHIAVLSKFYGVLFHKISSGKMTDVELLRYVNLRDGMGEQMAEIEPQQLLGMALEDHVRTIKALRTADVASLRREATVDGGETITAEEIARLPLINHLESHVEQLERSLG